MKKIIASIALMGMSTVSMAALSDADCKTMIRIEKEISALLPMQADEITTTLAFAVGCTAERVTYTKHLSVIIPPNVESTRLATALEGMQRHHTNLHCNKDGLARLGLAVHDNVFDKNMVLITILKTTPDMCE